MASFPDAETLALHALAYVVGDATLGERFLALTGLTPEVLRAGAGERDVLAAVLAFLEGDEASLVAAAHALDVPPERLAAAHRVLA